jgi:hypothetical protein
MILSFASFSVIAMSLSHLILRKLFLKNFNLLAHFEAGDTHTHTHAHTHTHTHLFLNNTGTSL